MKHREKSDEDENPHFNAIVVSEDRGAVEVDSQVYPNGRFSKLFDLGGNPFDRGWRLTDFQLLRNAEVASDQSGPVSEHTTRLHVI